MFKLVDISTILDILFQISDILDILDILWQLVPNVETSRYIRFSRYFNSILYPSYI